MSYVSAMPTLIQSDQLDPKPENILVFVSIFLTALAIILPEVISMSCKYFA